MTKNASSKKGSAAGDALNARTSRRRGFHIQLRSWRSCADTHRASKRVVLSERVVCVQLGDLGGIQIQSDIARGAAAGESSSRCDTGDRAAPRRGLLGTVGEDYAVAATAEHQVAFYSLASIESVG